MNTEKTTETAAERQPWLGEDGRVDLAVIRRMLVDGPLIGEHDDEYEARAIGSAEALCNEVEALRGQHTKLLALYSRNVGSLINQLDAATAEVDRLRGLLAQDESGPEPYPWRIRLSSGYEVGRYDFAGALAHARELHRAGSRVVRIDGPEGSVPLAGSALERELRDAARAELAAETSDDEGFCEAPVAVTMAVTDGSDIVFAWSCLQHADEFATDLESEFGMAPERAARRTASASCGHQGRQSMVSVAVPDEARTEATRCSRDDCTKPVHTLPGQGAPYYCGPVHAYADRVARRGGESR